MESFINLFWQSINDNLNNNAISAYKGISKTYKEILDEINQFHLFWESFGLKSGDKIAICSQNCQNYPIIYMAVVSGGYVAVLLSDKTTPDQIEMIISHSGSKILYVSQDVVESVNIQNLNCSCFDINDYSLLYQRVGGIDSVEVVDGEEKADTRPDIKSGDICTILYTSGSTGGAKGVLLTVNNITTYVNYGRLIPYASREAHVCILPYSHIFGLVCEMIAPLCFGMELIVFSNSFLPSLINILQVYKPRIIFSVPMLITKLVKGIVSSVCSQNESAIDFSLNKKQVRDVVLNVLGGRVELLFVGGAAISSDDEKLLVDDLSLPLVMAYGSSESGIISFGKINNYVSGSCGLVVPGLNIRIHSRNSSSEEGEIQLKGDNVFLGYYMDSKATAEAFTEDGWFKTGDMGFIDRDNNLFITGRYKDILLTSNGENVYPEDIEGVLNTLPYISESLLLQRGDRFHAIIVIDKKRIVEDMLDTVSLQKIMDDNIHKASNYLPGFSIIDTYEMCENPLERTPKGNIKRHKYA